MNIKNETPEVVSNPVVKTIEAIDALSSRQNLIDALVSENLQLISSSATQKNCHGGAHSGGGCHGGNHQGRG